MRSRSTTLFQLFPEICSGVKVRTFLGATGVNVWFSIIKMAQSRHHSSLPLSLRWIDGTAVYTKRVVGNITITTPTCGNSVH